MMIEIRWSKTIQFKQKILRLPVLPTRNKAICPVFWMHYVINMIPAQPTDPVLLLMAGKKYLHTISQSANLQIQEMVDSNRTRPNNILITLAHEGGVTFAYQSNLEAEMIKLLGDWASDAYKRYIDVSMEKRYESMKLFVEALNNISN